MAGDLRVWRAATAGMAGETGWIMVSAMPELSADRAAPLLSVVVPVYAVESYLPKCLDSLLAGGHPEIELLAVDDRSPDDSARILREYAARDDRLRVITLPENVGLGRARNAGLAQARGEYVWFVDSDDWASEGAVGAVLSALDTGKPDVLLLDHDRVFEDGTTELDPSSSVLRGVDGVTDLEESPQLLRLQHTAWNKVIRVELMRSADLTFTTGWYEDYPFSHRALLLADRIAVLDRICLSYRRGRPGAITTTISDRHVEALDQYERLFVELRTMGARYQRHRDQLFRLMINHLLVIVGNDNRVPDHGRRAFFHRISKLYRQYEPAGFTPPGGATGLKYRLVRRDAYLPYALLRRGQRLAGAAKRTLRRG
jgi:glycosyltransferase involved in cell wall biosynthesis